MTSSHVWLLLFLAFTGLCLAHPRNKGRRHYTVTWMDDDIDIEATTTTRPLLGEKPCTQGPAYWCHNITRASECHAVQHCITKVWEKQIEHQSHNDEEEEDPCKVCVTQVAPKRKQFVSNQTSLEVARRVLRQACESLDYHQGNDDCSQTAESFIQILGSDMDSQMFCHVTGQCHSDKIGNMLGQLGDEGIEEPTNDLCNKCKYYVEEFGESLKLLSKRELRWKLLGMCGHMGAYSESCRQAVIHELDAIYEFVQNRMEPVKLCAEVGFCSKGNVTRLRKSQSIDETKSACELCKDATFTVHKWIVTDGREQQFKEVLKRLCGQTGKYGSECLMLVEQYGKRLHEALEKDLNPENACESLRICSSNLGSQLDSDAPIWTVIAPKRDSQDEQNEVEFSFFSEEDDDRIKIDDDGVTPLMKGVRIPGEQLAGDDEMRVNEQTSDKANDNKRCVICEFIITKLDQRLKDNVTEEKVKTEVEQICTRLPRTVQRRCRNFVELYGDEMIKYFSQQVDPADVCELLKQCESQDATNNDDEQDDMDKDMDSSSYNAI